jgi:AcrR family transcriptional regulator
MSLRSVKPPHETRTRILDAAEELFMQHGFEATSMRLLTAKAGANLAAVNYHFGSKDALIEAVFRRRLDPMNTSRIAELDRLEKEAGGRALSKEAAVGVLSPEAIIRAFVGASLRMIEDAKSGGRNFIRLLGRSYTDPQKHIRSLIGQLYAPAMERFKAAFERALPQMPRDELVWRIHFMFGTLAYTLAATDTVQLIAGCKPEDRYDARLLEARLTAFLAAGLLAPLHNAADVKKAA